MLIKKWKEFISVVDILQNLKGKTKKKIPKKF